MLCWIRELHSFVTPLLVRVRDLESEIPPIELVPVVREFPDDLPRIPPKQDIDFSIGFLPNTHPISIPPYRMVPTELNEIKSQLKDFLDKVFILPSIYLWGAPLLFVKKKDDS